MNILVVSGGSGGHVNPAISLINNIKNHHIIYLGTKSKIEINKIPKLNIKYYLFNNIGLKKGLINKIKFIIFLFINFIKSIYVIKKEKINKIITFGGYSSSSVFLANIFLKKDIYIHEQNSIIGRNNKLMLRFARKIFTSFMNTKGIKDKYKNKVKYSANLSFFKKKKDHLNFNILIMTGSLGSSSVTNLLKPLLNHYQNIKMIGGINNEINHEKIISYSDNMEEILSEIDLVITRAGATSLNEISSLAIPSIIIPSPYVINDHQKENAFEYLKIKRGFLVEEKDIDINKLTNLVDKIKNNKFLYEEISKNASSFYNKDAINIIIKEMNLC